MSNVFDRADDYEDEPEEGDFFTVQYGCETQVVEVQDGMTIRDGFVSVADMLGFEFGRTLQYRDARGDTVNSGDNPVANKLYVASAQHESKG